MRKYGIHRDNVKNHHCNTVLSIGEREERQMELAERIKKWYEEREKVFIPVGKPSSP